MHEHPSLLELVEAVKHFVDETAAPALTGHAAFHARVASNVLAIITRELTLGPEAEAGEVEQLLALLNADAGTELNVLNRQLCIAIQEGRLTAASPGLLSHLKTTAINQLNIDQPHYSGVRRLFED